MPRICGKRDMRGVKGRFLKERKTWLLIEKQYDTDCPRCGGSALYCEVYGRYSEKLLWREIRCGWCGYHEEF